MKFRDLGLMVIIAALAAGSLTNEATHAQGIIVGICCAVLGIK